jgi:hypothetical protein
MKALREFDFAVFVLLPEDPLKINEREAVAVRDNVVFELGLFVGKLGRDRVFFIAPENIALEQLHLPNDLSGINPSRYDPRPEKIRDSVRKALQEFKDAIASLGKAHGRQPLLYQSVGDLKLDDFAHGNRSIEVDGKLSEGELSLVQGGVRVKRTNAEGRYEIELRPEGKSAPSFPALTRTIRISCEAMVVGGQHTVRFVMKDIKAGKWIWDKSWSVTKRSWVRIDASCTVPAVDLLFRIDDLTPLKVPSNL